MSVTTPYPAVEPPYPLAVCSFLGRVHAALRPIGYPVMRVAVGLALVPHGVQKFLALSNGHAAGALKGMIAHGYHPALFWFVLAATIEVFGGLMLAAGLLTRLVAAVIGIELLLILLTVLLPVGFFRYEFVLLWGLMVFGIGCVGGGPYSLDALIGREL